MRWKNDYAKVQNDLLGGSQVSTKQNVMSINPKKKATSGERIKSELEDGNKNTDMATTLRDEKIFQSARIK